jgi:hypothetical protein
MLRLCLAMACAPCQGGVISVASEFRQSALSRMPTPG